MFQRCFFFIVSLLLIGCGFNAKKRSTNANSIRSTGIDSLKNKQVLSKTPVKVIPKPKPVLKTFAAVADTTFVRLTDYSHDFLFDLKYATTDNFLKQKVYDCDQCWLRAATAKALIKANKELMQKGYRILFFDCYRPHDVQKKMWQIMPDPHYVANPKRGSIHNRGGAVDITLAHLDGRVLDMGTAFDFFGKKAHHAYTNLPLSVLKHRKLLRSTLEKHGFWTIRTEWWHYNLKAMSNQKNANFTWKCN